MLTQERLQEKLHYNPETGIFTCLTNHQKKLIGTEVGWIDPDSGYVIINIDGRAYSAHRLAYLYMTGNWPVNVLDHEDTIKHHNWWSNIRDATKSQNARNRGSQINNRSCGYKGVSWNKTKNKWFAQCFINGKNKFLGCYETAEEAKQAYDDFAKLHHKEFFNPG